MRTLFLLAVVALAALPGCSAEDAPVADNSSAYMFAIEPCMVSSQFGNPYTMHWVTIGPLPDGTMAKIRATSDNTGNGLITHTLTAQIVPASGPETTSCWDRFPSQVPEEYVSDNFTVPGTPGYWRGTYYQNHYVDLYGFGGVRNNANYNAVAWVRFRADVWNGSSFVPHRWVLNASDAYHWAQDY